MITGLPASELATLVAALLVAGALTGLLAGLFGVGGGAVIVPVLYELFRIVGVPDDARMPLCIGTSLAVIIPTSIRSFAAHRAKGAVDMGVLRAWTVSVVLGVIAASAIARYAPPEVFKAAFVLVAGFMALRLFFKRDSWSLGTDMPGGPLIHIYGLVIGALSSLMGIGGGALAAMVMTSYGRSIHQAIAT
ncbi:MAG TPA: sulfite exporter TauE/SafE family protein, partial [Beijerinckiaceae bacterium]|nr:sulfite exporter TauE/SafE family protein [Beijerinckiaceae bacterium]